MQWVRTVDMSAFKPDATSSQNIADKASGAESSRWYVAKVPPGKQAGPGMHVHVFDQYYYILSGTMHLEIGMDREKVAAGPNSLVVLPAGVPHRNWNEGQEDEIHINVSIPEPEAGAPADLRVHFDIFDD